MRPAMILSWLFGIILIFSSLIISFVSGLYKNVIRYSGRASEENFIKHKSILEDQLIKDNIKIQSPPIKATYNSPFTLPIMRRNEAMFRVEYKN